MHLYDCSSCITQLCDLDLMSGLITLMFDIVFKAKYLVLMDTFETREFILGQLAYTFKCSSSNASMQPPMSLIFIHVPVILPYISNTV